jgi:MFS transporter, DHA1 family, inner membrane transport protein
MTHAPSPRFALWALLFGNLVIGTGVLLPAGLLSAFMADYAVNAGRAGSLMFVGGLVVGIGAPVLAGLTTRVDRRVLLVLSLGIYAFGHLGATLTTDFTTLLFFRAVTVVGAAIFTPQAAATVGLLVPAEQRGGAIAFIFIGWSLASVLGIPLGSVLGDAIGWRQTFLLMAGLSVLAAGLVWAVLPDGLRVQRIDLSAWVRVLTDLRLLVVLAVTMFAMSGQFALFTYVAPVLKEAYAQTAQGVALTFLIVGVAGVCGNFAASRLAGWFGVERSILLALSLIAMGLAIVALGWGVYGAFLLGGCLWGLGGFASNSLQQSRLVGLAPVLASATVALNTSFVYLGQSLGSAAGGRLIVGGPSSVMAWAGFGFILCAMGLSVWAARMGRV